MTPSGITIRLLGALAKALETGYDAFDLKSVMLMSSAVKFTEKGDPYVDVPFRHGADSNTVRFHGMPADIKQQVQAKMRKARAEYGTLPERMRVTGRMPGKVVSKELRFGRAKLPIQTEHKTSIYSDMIREQLGAKTSRYMTIRRISANSDSLSWWHPGFAGIHAFEKAKPRVKELAIQMLRAAFANIGINAPKVVVT